MCFRFGRLKAFIFGFCSHSWKWKDPKKLLLIEKKITSISTKAVDANYTCSHGFFINQTQDHLSFLGCRKCFQVVFTLTNTLTRVAFKGVFNTVALTIFSVLQSQRSRVSACCTFPLLPAKHSHFSHASLGHGGWTDFTNTRWPQQWRGTGHSPVCTGRTGRAAGPCWPSEPGRRHVRLHTRTPAPARRPPAGPPSPSPRSQTSPSPDPSQSPSRLRRGVLLCRAEQGPSQSPSQCPERTTATGKPLLLLLLFLQRIVRDDVRRRIVWKPSEVWSEPMSNKYLVNASGLNLIVYRWQFVTVGLVSSVGPSVVRSYTCSDSTRGQRERFRTFHLRVIRVTLQTNKPSKCCFRQNGYKNCENVDIWWNTFFVVVLNRIYVLNNCLRIQNLIN